MTEIREKNIRRNFGRVWPAHVAEFTRYLIECRKHFRGDLDLLLLLAVIGDRTLVASKVRKSLTFSEFLTGEFVDFQPDAINYQSVADFTGMPRESVRRKVNALIDIGWVRRTDEGFLVATQKASDELAPLTEAGILYLVRQKFFSSAAQRRSDLH
jgi:hypothetical protein